MQHAVAMQRELRGSEPHPDLAEVLNDMGVLLDESGDLGNGAVQNSIGSRSP